MYKSVQHVGADSWIDIQSEENPILSPSTTMSSFADRDQMSASVHINENLLLEAQRESSRVSSKSSQSESPSPKSPKSPIQTDQNVANWMLYLSRIESEPPKDWKFVHPINRSVRDQLLYEEEEEVAAKEAEKALVEKKRVRHLLISNCASFILGMGIMYLCLRRYLRMKTPYFYALD